jgi:hypothetical protein
LGKVKGPGWREKSGLVRDKGPSVKRKSQGEGMDLKERAEFEKYWRV